MVKPERQAVTEYCEETSLHGVRFMTDERATTSRKLIWLVILIVSSGCLAYFIYRKTYDFNNQSIVTNIDVEYMTELTFPAVAICANNQFQ